MPAARERRTEQPTTRLPQHFFFLLLLNSERFTISVFHKTTWQVAAKQRKMDKKKWTANALTMTASTWDVAGNETSGPMAKHRASTLCVHLCLSVLVVCGCWTCTDYYVEYPRGTCGSGLSRPSAFTSESQWM